MKVIKWPALKSFGDNKIILVTIIRRVGINCAIQVQKKYKDRDGFAREINALHLTWVGISSAVHIQSMEKEADTQKLEGEKKDSWARTIVLSPAYHRNDYHRHLVNVLSPG